jgi:hypothetical protein
VEIAAGVNVGLWGLLRVGVQGESVRAEPNLPRRYLLGADPDRLAVLSQVGINF